MKSKTHVDVSKYAKKISRYHGTVVYCVRTWLEQRPDLHNSIKLFGAPFEAEAQCVHLEKHGLADGIISADSDILFHGGVHFYSGYNTCTSNGVVK